MCIYFHLLQSKLASGSTAGRFETGSSQDSVFMCEHNASALCMFRTQLLLPLPSSFIHRARDICLPKQQRSLRVDYYTVLHEKHSIPN